jgi:ElaB protein
MEVAGRTTQGTSDGVRTMARAMDEASAGAHKAIESASDATHPAVDRDAFGAHQAVDKIADAAASAAQSLGVKGQQLKSGQALALDKCRGYIRANPLAALGIAAAGGYLLSRLFSSR